MITITASTNPAGSVLSVRAHPGAGRNAIVGERAGALKVAVQAPPDRGRANEAIADLLAACLGLRGARVALVSGPTARDKRFFIPGLAPEEVLGRLTPFLEEAQTQ